ncbi:MFS transporter [Desulfurivibrio alkaliphilus]|nr:MFS transporter [Desulfurivibrio alkaliphilus]
MMLCGVGLLAIFSSTISKSPALPLLVDYLDGDPAMLGLVAAVSAATGIIFSLPAGLLSDRIGRRRMLLVAAVVFATAPFLYPLAVTPWHLILIRLYHGLATAIFIPVALAMVGDLYQQSRGEKMGWFSTATLLGRFAAPATGGMLLGLYGADPAKGFLVVYLVCGGAGVAVLLASLALPVAAPASSTGPAGPAAAVASAATTRDHASSPAPVAADGNWRSDLYDLLGNRPLMATCAVEAAILFAYGVFETFLPLHALAVGLSVYQIGICLSAQIITVALLKPLLGRFSDRHGRPPQILFGTLASGVTILLFARVESFPGLLLLSMILGLTIALVSAAVAAHIADLSRRGRGGSAMGMLGSIMDIGHTAGPLLGGLLAFYFGMPAAFLGAAGVLFLAAACFPFSQRMSRAQGRG